MSARRIVVSGMVVGDRDQGGAAWAVLQYVLGLRRLGHDVLLVEPVERIDERAEGDLAAIAGAYGFAGRAALLERGSTRTGLLPRDEVVRLCRRADVLLNLSGMLRDVELTERIPRRVYLDLDPAFNQLWAAAEGIDVGLDGHTHFVTVGQRVGRPGCDVPTCGRAWIATLPPVVLDRWCYEARPPRRGFSTVGNWRSYGSIVVGGVRYGQRAHSMRELLRLPERVGQPFEAALSIDSGEHRDLAALEASAWRLVDPRLVAATPVSYARFVRGSMAEIGIAKEGYARSRCGWFSDRSACYLASGRPVVAQDTGFGVALPTGQGLLAFTTLAEAVEATESVVDDYLVHRRAARRIAEEHLDSDRVLTRLLEVAEAA